MHYIISVIHKDGQNGTIECDTLAELESEYIRVRSWGNDWQIDVTCEVTRRYTLVNVTSSTDILVSDLKRILFNA